MRPMPRYGSDNLLYSTPPLYTSQTEEGETVYGIRSISSLLEISLQTGLPR
jgi:hypothetical protein